MSASCAIRGSFFDFVDDPWKHPGNEERAARFVGDGLLVVRDGIIEDFGSFADLSRQHADLPVTHLEDRLILPGFIDGHVHFPQVRVLGVFGNQLLDWLQTWIFPEELKSKDRAYARTAAGHFFDALLAGGTTTAMAFTTSSPVSTEEFFEEATRRGMRVIAGLSGIDLVAPEDFLITPDDFYRETKRLIERYHRNGRNLLRDHAALPGRLHLRNDGAPSAAEARAPGLLDQHSHLGKPRRSADGALPISGLRGLHRGACQARPAGPQIRGRARRLAVPRRIPPVLGGGSDHRLLSNVEPVPG